MRPTLDDRGLDLLFRNARTQSGWLPTPVSDAQLRAIYDIMRQGPTSANSCPARILFVRTPENKARLFPALSASNVEKTKAAPVTAIIGYDLKFHVHPPKGQDPIAMFEGKPDLAQTTALRG